MADRYFQCAMCKKLKTLDDIECYILKEGSTDRKTWTKQFEKLINETCACTGAKRRMRELTEAQNTMEVSLNKPINQ